MFDGIAVDVDVAVDVAVYPFNTIYNMAAILML